MRDLQTKQRQRHQHPIDVLEIVMAASPSDTMTPATPPLMALALNSGLPWITQLDQKTIQVWTLQTTEGRMRQDRADPFFVHTMYSLARSTQFPATPRINCAPSRKYSPTRGESCATSVIG